MHNGDTLDPTDRLHRQANSLRKQVADLNYRLTETANRLVEVERERDSMREGIKSLIDKCCERKPA